MSPDSGSLAPRPPMVWSPKLTLSGTRDTGPYIHASMHPSIHTYIQTHTQTDIHTYLPTYLHTYIPTYLRTYVPTYLHTHAHTHVTNAHTAWESWVIYTCKYVYVYIYIYYIHSISAVLGPCEKVSPPWTQPHLATRCQFFARPISSRATARPR